MGRGRTEKMICTCPGVPGGRHLLYTVWILGLCPGENSPKEAGCRKHLIRVKEVVVPKAKHQKETYLSN